MEPSQKDLLKGIQTDGDFIYSRKKEYVVNYKCSEMAPFYEQLVSEFKWKKDEALLKTLKAANAAELKKLDDKLEDAQTNLGETDVSDALIAKAQFYARIGDKVLPSCPFVKGSASL